MAFDVQAALKAGYSPADIADYLGTKSNFDVDAARKAGYKDDEITAHLLEVQPKASPQKPLPEGVTPSEGRSATPMGKPDPRLVKPEDDRTIMQRVKDFVNPEYKSVLETAAEPPTPVERQAEIDKRLSYGAGPISKETLGQADLVRGGLAQTEDPRVQQIAQEMANRGETGVGGLIARANKDRFLEQETETLSRQKFAEENPLLGSTAAGAAGMIAGAANIPSVAADAFNQTFVNPVLKAAGLDPLAKAPTAFGTEYLAKTAEDYMPQIGKRSMEGAWKNDEFAPWLMSKLAANSPQMAQQLAAAFVPPLRAVILPGMGATAAGQSYAQGDESRVALAKGLVEVGTEMLPLKVFDSLKGLSLAKQNTIMAIVGQRLLKTGGEIGAIQLTNAVEETAAQFGGNVLDKYFQGKDVELSKGLAEAALLGAATGTAMAGPGVIQTALGRNEPGAQIARAMNENIANTNFTGTEQSARDLLNPNTYDARLISPLQTVDPSKVLQAKTVDEAITSADDLAGAVNFTPPPTPDLTGVIPPTPDLTGTIPPTPDLTGPIPPTPDLTGRIEPTLDMQTPTVELPAPNPVTEQQFGLDKLRLAPAGVPSGNAPATAADKTLDIPGETLPRAATAPVGGESAATAARAAAQNSLDRWAAANNVDTPAVFNPATPEMDSAINDIAQALHSKFNARLYAYNDNRADALNGVAIGGAAFVNTGSVDINAARTSLHEFHHTIEQIAALEARQGQTNTEAQKYVASMNSIFDGMTDAGKQAYITNFLHKDELAGIADPVAREQRLQELIAAPQTRSEMVADFLGNRATDKKFWKDVAAADPQGFKGFVDKWIGIVDNLIDTLKGTKTQGRKESARVDKYVSDLNAAKAVARDALVNYSKGIQNGSINQGVSEFAASDRQVVGGDGGGETPSYGTPREGAVSLIGRHYSTEARTSLNGAYYGRGLKGAERDRLDSSPDPRLKNRVYFYVDQGQGIRPESGVGGIAHETKLNNIYDPKTGLIPVKGNFNAFESAVLNAGFDGYVAPFGNNQSAVVLLGPRHSAVPVRPLGRVAGAPAPIAAEPTTLKKGLLSKEVEAIQASRIPGARLASGNLEIPVASREAANAELERIGSDIRFSEKQPDLGKFRDVAKSLGLTEAQYNASVLGLMTGKTKSAAFEAPDVGGIPEVVQWLDQRYRDAGMPVLDLNKAEDRTTLARMLAAEAVGAIRSAGNAVEWYDETIAKTLRVMAVKYPELNTDASARNAFLMAVAISSQTMNVEDNLRYASSQYEAFRQSQQFPEAGTGKSAPAMAKNFALANRLLRDLGPVNLRRFLQTELTKRDLESMGFSIGGESMNEKVLGSAVFGPKIGFGFYSNLTGNFEPVTMDMWFMRTIGRLSGTLPAFDPVLFPKQVAKLRAALNETGDATKGVYAANFDPEDVAAAQQTDAGAIALARKIYSLHNRQFIKERAAFDSGQRKKTALVGAANAIIKSADKPTDAPGSGGERQRLRDVVRQMVDFVEKETGKRVPPAALQALIWYPEQELYKKLGVRLRVTSQDYAGAAQSLLTKEGFDGKRISAAAKSGPRAAQQVAGKQNAGATGPISGAGQKLDAFQGQEREEFIRGRTEQTLNAKAKAEPLADLFANLEKRGIAKANAESMVNRRDDAAQIRYIQNNFLDILDELDISGLVDINCK